jgi:hypothetical protein
MLKPILHKKSKHRGLYFHFKWIDLFHMFRIYLNDLTNEQIFTELRIQLAFTHITYTSLSL